MARTLARARAAAGRWLKPARARGDEVLTRMIHVTRQAPSELYYLRVTIATIDDVIVTMYEVDGHGWVHRQFQMRDMQTRFAPEDILMCRPINLRAIRSHPCSEEIDVEEFELLWGEVAGERSFAQRLPDTRLAWEGSLGEERVRLRWLPMGARAPGWTEVPGFVDLFVRGDAKAARGACAALFLETPIQWRALAGEVRADAVATAAA